MVNSITNKKKKKKKLAGLSSSCRTRLDWQRQGAGNSSTRIISATTCMKGHGCRQANSSWLVSIGFVKRSRIKPGNYESLACSHSAQRKHNNQSPVSGYQFPEESSSLLQESPSYLQVQNPLAAYTVVLKDFNISVNTVNCRSK